MKTFFLIAYFMQGPTMESVYLAPGLSLQDCAQALVNHPATYAARDRENVAFPGNTSFACEAEQ